MRNPGPLGPLCLSTEGPRELLEDAAVEGEDVGPGSYVPQEPVKGLVGPVRVQARPTHPLAPIRQVHQHLALGVEDSQCPMALS